MAILYADKWVKAKKILYLVENKLYEVKAQVSNEVTKKRPVGGNKGR